MNGVETMESVHYLLMKTHTNLNRWILNQAATIGLSPGQPKVLECLTQLGECNQKAIATYCEIEQATVGSILSRMERDGLICRKQRDGNRRSLYVSLTERGRERAQAMQKIFEEADAKAVQQLTQEQQQALEEMLQKIYQSVAPQEGEQIL